MSRNRKILRRILRGQLGYGDSAYYALAIPIIAATIPLLVPPLTAMAIIGVIVGVGLLILAFLFFLTIVGAPVGSALA